jgi:hypothetical protein
MYKKTDELMQILKEKPNADTYLKENKDELLNLSLTELLNDFLIKKNLTMAQAIRGSHLDRNYGYQIFDGRHKPTRSKLIALAFGLCLDVPETQQLLKAAQLSPLYPRIPRDVLILECIFQGKDLDYCNENLLTHGEDILE